MKAALAVMSYCVVLVMCVVAIADNPAPHSKDRTEMLFDPTAEEHAVRLLLQANGEYERDMQLPGGPIVEILIRPEGDQDALFAALPHLQMLRNVNVALPNRITPNHG
jgi:hypothetical protein